MPRHIGPGEGWLLINLPRELRTQFHQVCKMHRKTANEFITDWMRNPERLGESPGFMSPNMGDATMSIVVPLTLRERFKAACAEHSRSMTGEIIAMMEREVFVHGLDFDR